MAAIDQYNHELIDFFYCPSDYELVYGNTTRQIAIYRLLENIPKGENDFDGKVNDILVGGGSGEAQAMRISQNGIRFFLEDSFDEFNSTTDLVKTFWSPTFAFRIGNGLLKIGWNPREELELWFAKRVVKQLIEKEKILTPNKD